jgi:uncharacterized protein (TIGR04255 family)
MQPLNQPPLPEFDDPPVIEVVLGAQFAPIEGFQAPHFGLFWQKVRHEYPKIETAAPLASAVERFDDSFAEDAPFSLLAVAPLPRIFYIDSTDHWLIQLQPDHLLQNWRKSEGEMPYPRFPAVRQRFLAAWTNLREFCATQGFAPPRINQLEVTYINHIPLGMGWESPAEIGRVFNDFHWNASQRFLPPPESVGWRMAFALPEKQGRLHVSVRQAIRRSDKTPVLLCELIARGMPTEESEAAIDTWLEMGREWIVRAFADLTRREIQDQRWRRST